MSFSQPTAIQAAGQLSAHLKSLRKALGLTQAELGLRIGVKQVRVADIERNPGAVSVDQLLEVLHALNARLLLARNAPYAPGTSNPAVKASEPGPSW
jgi:HTH-type transcriptional regulator/antitoxin HipB